MTPTPVGLVLSGRRVNTAQPKKKRDGDAPRGQQAGMQDR